MVNGRCPQVDPRSSSLRAPSPRCNNWLWHPPRPPRLSGTRNHLPREPPHTTAPPPGEIIFRENPVATLQHQYNKLCLPACHFCLRTVGSLRTRIGQVLRGDREKPMFFEAEFPELSARPELDLLEYFSREQLRYEVRRAASVLSKVNNATGTSLSAGFVSSKPGHVHD